MEDKLIKYLIDIFIHMPCFRRDFWKFGVYFHVASESSYSIVNKRTLDIEHSDSRFQIHKVQIVAIGPEMGIIDRILFAKTV